MNDKDYSPFTILYYSIGTLSGLLLRTPLLKIFHDIIQSHFPDDNLLISNLLLRLSNNNAFTGFVAIIISIFSAYVILAELGNKRISRPSVFGHFLGALFIPVLQVIISAVLGGIAIVICLITQFTFDIFIIAFIIFAFIIIIIIII